MDKKKYPVESILEQLQKEEDSFSPQPGEEMTHVAGVSFVDGVGLSLGGKRVCMSVRATVFLVCIQDCVLLLFSTISLSFLVTLMLFLLFLLLMNTSCCYCFSRRTAALAIFVL